MSTPYFRARSIAIQSRISHLEILEKVMMVFEEAIKTGVRQNYTTLAMRCLKRLEGEFKELEDFDAILGNILDAYKDRAKLSDIVNGLQDEIKKTKESIVESARAL
jgi:hypothetical protein